MKDRSYWVDCDEATVLQMLEDRGSIVVGRPATERLVYRDTFDWRLYRAGYYLATSGTGKRARCRLEKGGATHLVSRLSGIPRFAEGMPVGPMKDLIRPVAGPRRLLAMGRAEWTESVVAILNNDEKTVVRVALRKGIAFSPGSNAADQGKNLPLRVIVRPLKGYRKEAKALTRDLAETCKTQLCDRTEPEDVLHAVGNPPGAYSSSLRVSLDHEMEAGESLTRVHRALLDILLVNQEGVVRDWDPEFLHDFRVACRRARTGLTQLRGLFPESVAESATREFKWLGGLTGPKRDLDVYLLRIPGFRASLAQPADDDLEPLVRLLEEKREIEHQRLVRGLRSRRYRSFIHDWRDFLHGTASERDYGPGANVPVALPVTDAIRRALRRVLETGERIRPETEPEALHRLRIQCKKLRYLITLFRSLFPPSSLNPVVKELKQLQGHLGEFNDLHVQQVALRTSAEELMAAGKGPPATLLAMGQLLGRLEGAQARERGAFESRFRHFARAKNRRRFEALFGPWEDS